MKILKFLFDWIKQQIHDWYIILASQAAILFPIVVGFFIFPDIASEEPIKYVVMLIFFIIIYSFIANTIRGVMIAFSILKRLGVTKYNYKLNYNVIKELKLLREIGINDFEIVSVKILYKHRYDDYFYKSKKEEYRSNVLEKLKQAYSESFLMKNNLPKTVTEEQICATHREKIPDRIFYGFHLTGCVIIAIIYYI